MPDPTRSPAFAMPIYFAPAPGASSYNVAAAATSEIYAGPGYVTGVSINTGVAGKTVKLYDGDPGAAGVLLGTWSAAAQNSVGVQVPFAGSLWIVTDGTADVTIAYVKN